MRPKKRLATERKKGGQSQWANQKADGKEIVISKFSPHSKVDVRSKIDRHLALCFEGGL